MSTNFELQQFLEELYLEVNSLAFTDDAGGTKENKFTEYVMSLLEDAGETESTRLCFYMKETRQESVQYKINGYGIEEGFETLHIFVTHYQDTRELYKLPKQDFDKMVKWPANFLNAAFKGHLEGIEPSTEAFGLAKLIKEQYRSFDRVNIFIVTNGVVSHEAPEDYTLRGLEDTTFLFHVWDIERLHRLSQSKYNREPIEIDFQKSLGETIPCLAMPSGNQLYECYLAIVPGRLLSILYKNYGTRLLESNVRAFLQQTGKINKGIRDTIREKPYMFLPYNNGLATTAQEVRLARNDVGQLVITGVRDFQIVNGGQTTASLFHTEKKYGADLSQVYVQMKLTVIKDEERKNETVPFISRYANSQNTVTELDLTSNSPFLQRLEELSRTTYAVDPDNRNNQTLWFFERVKGQYKEAWNKEPTRSQRTAFEFRYPRKQIIVKSEVAKYMNVWFLQPFNVAKGAQKNYTLFIKEIEKEFKKKKPGRLYWKDIVSNAILFRKTDTMFGRKNQDAIGDTNIKSQTVSYTLSFLHFLTGNRLNLEIIWEKQNVPDELQKEIKKLLIFVYNYLINLDVALVSEAAKSDKTWKDLISKTNHPLNMEVISSYVLSDSEYYLRYEQDEPNIEDEKSYNDLNKIAALGVRFWDGLYNYNHSDKVLSQIQENNVYKIRKSLKDNHEISDLLIRKGVEIINMLSEKGIEFEKIRALSKLDEMVSFEPTTVYNRLISLSEADWSRVIDLGEQTNTLAYSEINLLKTVFQKMKRGEKIEFQLLKGANEALGKMKKFGIKA